MKSQATLGAVRTWPSAAIIRFHIFGTALSSTLRRLRYSRPMSRQTYVFDRSTGAMIAKADHRPPYSPKPYSDTCEVVSQISGETFSSKAGLRQHYRREGAIEVGNERMMPNAPDWPAPIPHDDIRRTLWEARNER